MILTLYNSCIFKLILGKISPHYSTRGRHLIIPNISYTTILI